MSTCVLRYCTNNSRNSSKSTGVSFHQGQDESTNEKRRDYSKYSKIREYFKTSTPKIFHYVTLIILGLLSWALLFFAFGPGWWLNGPWFKLLVVAVVGWCASDLLQATTSQPGLLAALLVGILARHFEYLDMRDFTEIDVFLRQIYPVIILGKGSLMWDLDFMKANWRHIACLGVVPWSVELVTVATCMHLFLGHPWLWGFFVATFYCSITGPIIMPNVMKVGVSPRRTHNWPMFICLSGGIDTTLSVGVYGVLASFLFSGDEISDTYRYVKAFSAIFLGLVLGIAWGNIAGLIPHSNDVFVSTLRILFVLIGGLLCNFAFTYFSWGGVAGVAVLACNSTAFHHWKKDWVRNNNPAATAYRVMWAFCEPALFAYTGTFLVLNQSLIRPLAWSFVVLVVSLTVRLIVAALMSWHLAFKEKLFICCCWTAKSIVEAVLCPMALNIVMQRGGSPEEMRYAEDIFVVTLTEIIITTPLAHSLTKYLGPKLLKDKPIDES